MPPLPKCPDDAVGADRKGVGDNGRTSKCAALGGPHAALFGAASRRASKGNSRKGKSPFRWPPSRKKNVALAGPGPEGWTSRTTLEESLKKSGPGSCPFHSGANPPAVGPTVGCGKSRPPETGRTAGRAWPARFDLPASAEARGESRRHRDKAIDMAQQQAERHRALIDLESAVRDSRPLRGTMNSDRRAGKRPDVRLRFGRIQVLFDCRVSL